MNALLKRLGKASRDGNINELKQLMNEDPTLLDSFDHDVLVREARDNPLHIAASYGHVDFTIEVLRLKPQLAGMPNKEGRLPLHFAAARGHVEVVKLFVNQQDAQKFSHYSESKYGYMPVHIAAINGKHTIVKMLVERCRDLSDKTTYRKETLIHLAVIANCLDSVCYLIIQGDHKFIASRGY
ncbi:Ankyrin repeat-containing protein [Rhynchospora pubera]|uniref:Ankyrin repeat-containing protein n=1 Tax=Rhynchospora pubera TaxID=906938 RepID=A0AAV8HZA5_9POAL|nr:Ankyrin repeat-containing protein [Rhynchospora pubera]